MSLNLVVLLTIVSAGDVVRYLVAGLAALAAHIDQSEISIEVIWPIRDKYWDQATNQRRVLPEHGELLVEHPLELVGRHVGHALVGLQTLQLDQSEISIVTIWPIRGEYHLVQAPVQLLKRLHRQPDIGPLLWSQQIAL